MVSCEQFLWGVISFLLLSTFKIINNFLETSFCLSEFIFVLSYLNNYLTISQIHHTMWLWKEQSWALNLSKDFVEHSWHVMRPNNCPSYLNLVVLTFNNVFCVYFTLVRFMSQTERDCFKWLTPLSTNLKPGFVSFDRGNNTFSSYKWKYKFTSDSSHSAFRYFTATAFLGLISSLWWLMQACVWKL